MERGKKHRSKTKKIHWTKYLMWNAEADSENRGQREAGEL